MTCAIVLHGMGGVRLLPIWSPPPSHHSQPNQELRPRCAASPGARNIGGTLYASVEWGRPTSATTGACGLALARLGQDRYEGWNVMRIALVSDIHSNLVALEAVLEALPEFDQLWCLGDTIGYGPRPNECLEYMRGLGAYVLTGNHDLACLGKVSLEDFNPIAMLANEWNGEQLQPELRAFLQERPARLAVEHDATLAHASPRDPVWEYIDSAQIAQANFAHFQTRICLVGHTHVPTICALHPDGKLRFGHAKHNEMLQLEAGVRYILNPGSVGQPRDEDPRAAYAMWDTEAAAVQWGRIGYDVGATQRQIRAAGLPEWLAERLATGE